MVLVEGETQTNHPLKKIDTETIDKQGQQSEGEHPAPLAVGHGGDSSRHGEGSGASHRRRGGRLIAGCSTSVDP